MEQRALRNEIFKILFEHELIDSDIEKRIEQFLQEHKLSAQKKEFFKKYIEEYIKNEKKVIPDIKDKLIGWTFERLGIVEKVLLKMSFFEITIKNVEYEIAINEAIELSKIYGDIKTKDFVNGILADLVKNRG